MLGQLERRPHVTLGKRMVEPGDSDYSPSVLGDLPETPDQLSGLGLSESDRKASRDLDPKRQADAVTTGSSQPWDRAGQPRASRKEVAWPGSPRRRRRPSPSEPRLGVCAWRVDCTSRTLERVVEDALKGV
jgi:hypothetical protein